jgi:hypothetical protein
VTPLVTPADLAQSTKHYNSLKTKARGRSSVGWNAALSLVRILHCHGNARQHDPVTLSIF